MAFEMGIRDAETIERWGIVRAHRRGSMGAHSHRVAIYADQIATILDWHGDRAALLRYALWHDMEETWMGDIVGPVKRAVVNPVRWTEFQRTGMYARFPTREWDDPIHVDLDEVQSIVKLADLLDEVLWCIGEQRMGNSTIEDVRANSTARLWRAFDASPFAVEPSARVRLTGALRQAIREHQTSSPVIVMDPVE